VAIITGVGEEEVYTCTWFLQDLSAVSVGKWVLAFESAGGGLLRATVPGGGGPCAQLHLVSSPMGTPS
jgi:hypothetical protein